jgi:hypothetical protein
MSNTFTKTTKGGIGNLDLADLRDLLVQELHRLNELVAQVECALGRGEAPGKARTKARTAMLSAPPARPSPLDQVQGALAATADLRVANGNLSADRVAKLFGVPLSQLAGWLGRSKQAVSKTPDADSLQDALGYFERVARLRLLLKDDGEFRKWLRTPHPDVVGKNPMELLARNEGQALADFVDDILSGTPG